MNIIQVERRFSHLGGRSLDNVVIGWWQSGSRRFAGFRVQNPRLLRSSGRKRRKKSNKISRNDLELPSEKRLTNFRIKGIADLWILEDRNMVSAEVWESKGGVCNHPFFCSTLLRCDLLAKKVPGRAPYSQHIIIRNWT